MAIEALGLDPLGRNIRRARQDSELNQSELAERSSLTQAQISFFELGRRQPSLDQILRIAKALDVPVQRLLTGSDRPGESLAEIAVELRRLGIEDLWIKGAIVPGAFRRPEEVISLALSTREPDPRIVEALPAILAWNEIDPALLHAYGTVTKTKARIAWLADIALSIERQGGFPGGCRKEPLELFLDRMETAKESPTTLPWDDLGKPTSGLPTSPIWKRWHINYDASLNEFKGRARHLNDLRTSARWQRRLKQHLSDIRMQANEASNAEKAGLADKSPKTDTTTKPTTSKARKPRRGGGPGRQ